MVKGKRGGYKKMKLLIVSPYNQTHTSNSVGGSSIPRTIIYANMRVCKIIYRKSSMCLMMMIVLVNGGGTVCAIVV